jgi:glycosyltransferase involved in cell wall biosynthesis
MKLTFSIADQNFERGKSLGILNVSLNLLRELARRADVSKLTVFSNSSLDAYLRLPNSVTVRHHDIAIAGKIPRMIWDQWGVYRAAMREENEWLFLTKGFASFAARCPIKLASIVYDAMTDYYLHRYPRVMSLMEGLYFKKSMEATLRQASVIFTISEFTTSEIQRLARESGIRCPRVVTMGIGFERDPFGRMVAARGSVERSGLLVLSSRWPHKRTDLAVEFLSRWQNDSGFKEPVHWVGSLPPNLVFPSLPNWIVHPRLSNDQYSLLMAGSRAVLFFSEYEGFGMPPVEAALTGSCPVYSDIPATREVMAAAGYSFCNDRYDSFAGAMNKAMKAVPKEIRDWADQLLARHNWQTVCTRVIEGLLSIGNDTQGFGKPGLPGVDPVSPPVGKLEP